MDMPRASVSGSLVPVHTVSVFKAIYLQSKRCWDESERYNYYTSLNKEFKLVSNTSIDNILPTEAEYGSCKL
jgi:hypothetical protein